ncbi:FecR family protein [Sunxiuqinia indica]|uniref:FecR family protein n=1 Tax=Sunxiuqinia indica TaxID=2692584 RepID=UPI001358D55D|nr:FecR domain-containing protein [Sunxiuqinia indica]
MNIKQYQSYNTEEFILDDYFMKLAKEETVNGTTLNEFKSLLPEKKSEIELAAEIVKQIQSEKVTLPKERKDIILHRVFKREKIQLRNNLIKYAAAAILAIGIISTSILLTNQRSNLQKFASLNKVKSENAELVLANGERVEIESKQSKIEYTPDGTSVSLNDTSKLEQEKVSSEESFNQVIVPFGKRSSILLSDGTVVNLNSGSRLVYPPVFDKKIREVFLEGEAYFEVSKDKTKPFIVRTDEFKVKVLGTKFAVQAFKKQREYNTLLVEGSVSLSSGSNLFSKEQVLKPNQKATLTNSTKDFKITEVEDVQNQIAWIHGYLIFNNEDLESLTKKVSRYYNIDIAVFTTGKTGLFSGKLDLKDDPERVIEGLSTIFKVKYENQNGTIVFKD